MKVFSEEAIAFQPASAPKKLASDLTALFQEVIDYRNKITSSDSERVEAVKNYFVKVAAPKLIKIIYQHTGINVKVAIPNYLIANWAIGMSFDDEKNCDSIGALINRYSGLINTAQYEAYVRYRAGHVRTKEELEELSKSLEHDTGFVKTAMMEKHHFKCKLYFDVYASFLIKEAGARACEPLTAHEITAVVLHEIGHALSFIEHAADMYYKHDVMTAATKSYLDNADDKEKLKYISTAIGTLYPESIPALNKIADYVETQKKNKGNIVYGGFKLLLKTAQAILLTLGYGAFNIVVNTVKNVWMATIGGDIKALKSIKDVKTSDLAITDFNHSYCEILADEYVTRFGYGGHLASQMKKVYSWSRITGLGDMWMHQFASVSFFGRLLPWAIYTSLYGDKYSKDYPTEMKRYELMLTDTLKAFKDNNLSEELLGDYYASYKTIKQIISNPSKEQRYTEFWNSLHDIVNYIVKTPESLIFTGRFDREYERLFNHVKSLTDNELYAMAYALKK